MKRPRTFVPVAVLVLVGISGGPSTPSTSSARSASTAQGSMRQIVLIDPATGQPRDLTQAELAALQAPSTAEVPPQPIVSPTTGLEGLQLSEDQTLYSVATKRKDGTIAFNEVNGKREADRRVKAGASDVLQAGREAANDR
jgi:hypothetical protein